MEHIKGYQLIKEFDAKINAMTIFHDTLFIATDIGLFRVKKDLCDAYVITPVTMKDADEL